MLYNSQVIEHTISVKKSNIILSVIEGIKVISQQRQRIEIPQLCPQRVIYVMML